MDEIVSKYTTRLDLIHSSPLPLVMKLEAVGQVGMSKIHHLFPDIHIPRKALQEVNNRIVQRVRQRSSLQ